VTGTRLRLPRGAVVAAGVAAGLLVVALVGGRPGRDGPPLDPRSDGPLGTSALVSLLRGLGAEVDLSTGLPGPADDVALLLRDRLDEAQADDLLAWVADGGRVVVTDPRSRFTPAIVGPGIDDLVADSVERGTCTIDALDGVGSIDAGTASRYEVADADDHCLGDDDAAYVVTRSFGRGDLVAVGGAAALTNDLLDERDNAVLAAGLLSPVEGTRVRMVDPPVPAGGGQRSLSELVPPGVRRALVQLGIAFVLYALWRTIRLGRPVREHQPVHIAGSELVAAVGRLLSRTRHPEAAAEAVRGRLRRALRTRVGVPDGAAHSDLAAAVAARTGVDVEQVLAAIDDRPVRDDEELVAVARSASSLSSEVLR
jgi:hypothetical protein